MTEPAKNAIRTITAEIQPTKTGFVKTLIPEIDEALAAGYTLKSIWERIRTQRSDLTYSQFCLYLRRIRKKTPRTAAASGRKTDAEVSGRRPDGFDPLANIRRLEASRPGFHYRGTQDLEILVHGRKKDDNKQSR